MRSQKLATIICVLLIGTLALPIEAGTDRPNIVFIVVDDLRWDDLGCTGNSFVQTPHIDRLASEGTRFLNAFITTPLCSPSRATILTSQYPHSHGITDNTDRSPQSHRLQTFPITLQAAGYETAYVGKWHMGNDHSARPGFNRWFCLQGQGKSFDSMVNDDGKERQTKGYVTDVLTETSVQFLKQPHSKPFLLYLSHKAIHPETAQAADGKLSDPTASNFVPAPRHAHLYEGVTVPRRPNAGVPPLDKPALQQVISGLPPLGPSTGSSDTSILNRLRMLSAVDEGVGAIRQTLEVTGQLDKTLIVLIGDHGYFYGEHGLSVERRLAYEESIRIPMLMRFPKLISPNSAISECVLGMDMAPTFVELAGAQIPDQYQGQSVVPILEGKTPSNWRTSFLVEYYTDTVFPRMNKMGYRAIRGDRWKYIRYNDLVGMDELYDLQQDPYELTNRIADPAAQNSLQAMKTEMTKLLTETGGN